MAFGRYEYQHRFFKNQPHKRLAALSPTDNGVLPLSLPEKVDYYTPQLPRHQPYSNQLNLRVRAGQIGYNEPGWQSYKLKSYVTDKYAQNYRNYQNDRDIIQRFKQEAEQQKRKRRFAASKPLLYDIMPQHIQTNLPHIQQRGEQNYQPRIPSPKNEFNLYPVNNPQLEKTSRLDVGIMAKLYSPSPSRNSEVERKKQNQEKRQLKEYKRKYSRLKKKLKQQLHAQRRYQTEQIDARDTPFQSDRNLSRIEELITSVSEQMAKNQVIISEGIRVERELQQIKQAHQRQAKEFLSPPSKQPPQSRTVLPLLHKNSLSDPIQQGVKLPSPRIVYAKKELGQSYQQLDQLRKQINGMSKRIDYQYSKI